MLTEPPNAESQSLASFIQDALVAHTQAVNRGTKPEQFYVLANVLHPAVLVEAGFITNKSDVSKLENEQYREQIARAISEGIMAYREVVCHNQPTLALAVPRSE
jgi:N-acetylmuramoyl-L-alanine amidase